MMGTPALVAEMTCVCESFLFSFFFFFGFSRQGFAVALESVLELALVDQTDPALTEIRLPLPPECWD